MNDSERELMNAVLSQVKQIDFRAVTKSLKPDIEPDKITRAMIESSRLRWKGLRDRHGFPPTSPSPKKAAPDKDGTGRRAGKGRGRKRKADIDENGEASETPSPSKKKDKGQGKVGGVTLERSDQEDKAFEDAIYSMDMRDCEV